MGVVIGGGLGLIFMAAGVYLYLAADKASARGKSGKTGGQS